MALTIFFAVRTFSLTPGFWPKQVTTLFPTLMDSCWHISQNHSVFFWRVTVVFEAGSFIFNHLASNEKFLFDLIKLHCLLLMPVAERQSWHLLCCQSEAGGWSEFIHACLKTLDGLRFGQQAEWNHQRLRSYWLSPPFASVDMIFFSFLFFPPCIISKGSLLHCPYRHVIETQSCSCGCFVNSTIGTANAAVFSVLSFVENLSF